MMRFHEEWAIISTLDPIDANGVTSTPDEIDLSKYSEFVVIAMAGVVASSSTLTATFSASETSGGSLTAVTGKTITGTATSDTFQYVVTVLPEEITSQNRNFRYGKIEVTFSAHSQLWAILVLGRVKYPPATDHDLSTVQTIID